MIQNLYCALQLDKVVKFVPREEEEILDLAAEGIWLEKTSKKDLVDFILQRVTCGAGEKKIKKMLDKYALEENRIVVRRSGRAKDLIYGLTAEELSLKKAQEMTPRELPF